MKNKLNIKGFTMVELLAAIVILGILSTIGIATVTKILDNARNNYYKTSKNTLLEAGQSYVLNNRNLLPKNIGEVKIFTLKQLYDSKVLTEKLTDENGDECDADDSKFYVYKKSTSDYSYDSFLSCKSCRDKKDCKSLTAKKAPNISISSTGCGSNLEGKNDAKVTITITASSSEDKISSYMYSIYKNNKSIYSSGVVRVKSKYQIKMSIKLSEYLPGNIKIVVNSTTDDGATSSNESTLSCADTTSVVCGSITYEKNTDKYNGSLLLDLPVKDSDVTTCEDNEWINNNKVFEGYGRKVWVTCEAGTGVPCKEPSFSGTYTKDSVYKQIEISDTENNKTYCNVRTCIDRTYPKINVEVYKADSDGKATGSAIKTFSVDAKKDESLSKVTGQVTGWINKSMAPNGVVIRISASDKTSKVRTLIYKEKADGKTKKEALELEFGSEINLNIDTNDILLNVDGYKQYEVIATDHAGNVSILDFDIRLDRTKPSIVGDVCRIISSKTGNGLTVTESSITIKDDLSGLNTCDYYSYNDVDGINNLLGYKMNGRQYMDFAAEGSIEAKNVHCCYGKITNICDVAGNCNSGMNDYSSCCA